MTGRNLLKLLFVWSLLCSSITLAKEATGMNANSIDPDYERLVPFFMVKDYGSNVPYSEIMESFLGRYKVDFQNLFSDSDATKITIHWKNWLEDLRLIINTSNAYDYIQLSKFDDMTLDEYDVDMLMDYTETLDRVEREHEERIVNHHKRLFDDLSEEGVRRITHILEDQITSEIKHNFESGARSRTVFDMKGFIQAHPEVMARQLHLENIQRKKQGPPRELVYVTKTVDEIGGRQLMSLGLEPKGEEK